MILLIGEGYNSIKTSILYAFTDSITNQFENIDLY